MSDTKDDQIIKEINLVKHKYSFTYISGCDSSVEITMDNMELNLSYIICGNCQIDIVSDEDNGGWDTTNPCKIIIKAYIFGDLIINSHETVNNRCWIDELIFKDCTVEGNVYLNANTENMTMKNATVHGSFHTTKTIINAKFEDTTFNQNLIVDYKISTFNFDDCTVNGNTDINGDTNMLNIWQANFKGNLTCRCNDFTFDTESTISGILCIKANTGPDDNNTISDIYIDESEIGELIISDNTNHLYVKNSKIGSFVIDSIVTQATVSITDCNDCKFEKIQDHQKLKFIDGELTID